MKLILVIFLYVCKASQQTGFDDKESTGGNADSEYKQGSICTYCKYCKLCELCSKCPCEEGGGVQTDKRCDMCKYCKYCNICGSICDTVCTPGSFLDMFSSAVYDTLPTLNAKTRASIEEDINNAKDFIKEYL